MVAQATVELNHKVFAATGLTQTDLSDLFRLLRKLRRAAGDF